MWVWLTTPATAPAPRTGYRSARVVPRLFQGSFSFRRYLRGATFACLFHEPVFPAFALIVGRDGRGERIETRGGRADGQSNQRRLPA
uniref:Uncharacterized protein n=1 Tax=Oryza barthii TaxID=65489 RepID=A0A0D3EU63_9ORYZ